jgi:hypothetical protein
LILENRFARVETEFRVKTQRTIVKCRLEQPNAAGRSSASAIDDRLHELAADCFVLACQVDRDRPDTRDWTTLVEGATEARDQAVDPWPALAGVTVADASGRHFPDQ